LKTKYNRYQLIISVTFVHGAVAFGTIGTAIYGLDHENSGEEEADEVAEHHDSKLRER
jgi:hypothetical protein